MIDCWKKQKTKYDQKANKNCQNQANAYTLQAGASITVDNCINIHGRNKLVGLAECGQKIHLLKKS